MREDGATICSIDGGYPGLFGEEIPLPPTILRHRPDAMGTKKNGQIYIGEAKTENDILNDRTYEQLQDFATIKLNKKNCEVIIGIPKSSQNTFDKSLKKLGLNGFRNIHVLYIPDELIND